MFLELPVDKKQDLVAIRHLRLGDLLLIKKVDHFAAWELLSNVFVLEVNDLVAVRV